MPFPSQHPIALLIALALVLTACGGAVQHIEVVPSPTNTKGVQYDSAAACSDGDGVHRTRSCVLPRVRSSDGSVVNAFAEISRVARDVRKVGDAVRAETVRKAAFVIAVSKIPTVRIGTALTVTQGVVGDTAAVRECIKRYESGNYAESSHPGSGSGAYQYIPSTWATWSERAGYPGYAYAHQAPPAVQDAVTDYALTHGGAGNWSMNYGNDPCTAGLGG